METGFWKCNVLGDNLLEEAWEQLVASELSVTGQLTGYICDAGQAEDHRESILKMHSCLQPSGWYDELDSGASSIVRSVETTMILCYYSVAG